MIIESFKITKDKLTIQEPFFRISNNGCGADGCKCSPKNFISISDGKIGITIDLSNAEWNKLAKMFKEGKVWADWQI